MKTKEQIIKEIERLKSELDLMSKSILNMEFKNDTKKLTYNLVYQEMIKMKQSTPSTQNIGIVDSYL